MAEDTILVSMEQKGNRKCLATSGTVAAVTATAINRGGDITGIQSSCKSLPLSNFKAYCDLVTTLYGSSLAVILGNSLEWLDFSIYGYSSAEISSQLFGGSKTFYWTSFGLGFGMRPLGAYVLGKLADQKSRKLSFIVSMLAMSISTALMSLIPAVCSTTDASIDSFCVSNLWMSAIPAIGLRCIQGFSAGAAAGGVNVIQSELWSTTERKGAIAQSVGVQNVSGGGASMLSAAIVYGLRAALGDAQYAVWGWRIAFLVVVPPSLFASYLMHNTTPESNDFAKRDGHVKEHSPLVEDVSEEVEFTLIKGSQDTQNISNIDEDEQFSDEQDNLSPIEDCRGPLCRSPSSSSSLRLRHNYSSTVSGITGDSNNNGIKLEKSNITPWWLLISVITFSQFAISGFNNLTVFLVEFAQTNYDVTANTSILMQVAGKGIQVLMTPFAATLGDIKGWYWTCAFGGTLCTILALPMMIAGDFGGMTVAWIMISGCLPVVSSFWILNAPLLATSVFPVDYRSRGTSLVLATAAGIAGFLPLLLEQISSTYAQGSVLTIVAGLGTIGIIWVRNQAKRGNVNIYQRPELF